ncbi:MAG: TIGR03084 family metal-binding protein [Pseudomonadota bacterium]
MLQQAADLRTEGDALFKLLNNLEDSDWDRATLFKGWTVNDVIQHLHDSDLLASASARNPEEYSRLRGGIMERRDAGLSRVEEARQRFGDLKGRKLLTAWRETLTALCDALADRDPKERLRWAGPDMGVRMFTTARQMETWAHGQEIYDLRGIRRENTDRIKNIAVLGVRTFGWTFTNRGEAVPGDAPFVRLTAPSGDIWDWNDPASDNRVEGDAVAFCQVVTQVRNIKDTDLAVSGETAERWMSLAQCFAGPPEDPPAPGARL